MTAEVTVGYNSFQETYTSHVVLEPYSKVQVRSGEILRS
jgi:ribosome-associated toxin RatA of RatAB toxin-antitoxin module